MRRRMKVRGRFTFLSATVCVLSFLVSSAIVACPYSVRDVGFVDLGATHYRFYCIVGNKMPEKERITSTFVQIAGAALADSNVEAEVVDLGQEPAHSVAEYVQFWDIDRFPAAILVSPQGHSMVLPISEPEKAFDQTVWAAADTVISSPKRDELTEHIVRAWCVVLLVEGNDDAENARARDAVAEATELIAGATTTMGRVVREGPHVIVVSPELFEEEEILLWSLGLDEYDGRGARLAVLYGRGRQMGPVLEGDNLTRDSVLSILYTIGMDCGCETDPRLLAGRLIPLRWGSDVQAEVLKHVGFDAESPMVRTEIGSIWAAGPMVEAYEDGPLGYSEGVFVYDEEPLDSLTPRAVQSTGKTPPSPVSTLAKRATQVVWFMISGMVLLVLVGGGFIVLRAR